MLVQGCLRLGLELEDVAEARVQSDLASAVEANLGTANIRVRHVLTVHVVYGAQDLFRHYF